MGHEIRETGPVGVARRQGGATRFPGQGAFPDENVWAGYRSLPPGDWAGRLRVIDGTAQAEYALAVGRKARRQVERIYYDRLDALHREYWQSAYGEPLPTVNFTGRWQARRSAGAYLFLGGVCLLLAVWAVGWTIARVLT